MKRTRLEASFEAVDAHCHLDRMAEAEVVPKHSSLARVSNHIDPHKGYEPWKCYSEEGVYFTVGCHPRQVRAMTEKDWKDMEVAAEHPRVVGVGETGLDKVSMNDGRKYEEQLSALAKHVDLAMRTGKPLVLHCRESEPEVIMRELDRLSQGHPIMWHAVGVLPGADLLPVVCERYSGMVFGIGTMLLGVKGELVERAVESVVRSVPLSRLVLETDSPHLSCVRSREGQSADVWWVGRRVAEVLQKDIREVMRTTAETAVSFFGLK